MGYVLTNGKCYIWISATGKVMKSPLLEDARVYADTAEAKICFAKAPKKTKGYYILDVDNHQKYCCRHGRIIYPKEVRKQIYDASEGRCVLCGRKIIYDDMTLDHVTPLAMNGKDSVDNLACTCEACNKFKGSILPDAFMERVTEIFLYQTGKKSGKSLRWKLICRMINKIA